jgi:D-tyrosyl-tRNA(Tyr) deacylase
VSRACVRVADRKVGEIRGGLLVLVSVGIDDDERDVRSMAEKVAELRIFPDANGLMNRSLQDAGGALLLVSQFTLHGDVRRGRRPSFVAAAPPARARSLYELLRTALASLESGWATASSGPTWPSSWSTTVPLRSSSTQKGCSNQAGASCWSVLALHALIDPQPWRQTFLPIMTL